MKFMEIQPKDSGNYTCIASNSAGRIDFTFIVNVIGMVFFKFCVCINHVDYRIYPAIRWGFWFSRMTSNI